MLLAVILNKMIRKIIFFSFLAFVLSVSASYAASCDIGTKTINGYNVQITLDNIKCSSLKPGDTNWAWNNEVYTIVGKGAGTWHTYPSCGNHHIYNISAIPTPPPVNGGCGSANGGIFATAPTANRCSSGSVNSFSGIGPWTWTCSGSNGGSNARCSAHELTSTTNPSCTDGIRNQNETGVDCGGVCPACASTCLGGNCGGSNEGDNNNSGSSTTPPGVIPNVVTPDTVSYLDCSVAMTVPSSGPVNVNISTDWTVTPPSACPNCPKIWSVSSGSSTVPLSTTGNIMSRIFTTVGSKVVAVQFSSSTSAGLRYGNPCTATTTVVQTGGTTREI